jgi:hypothetical protein
VFQPEPDLPLSKTKVDNLLLQLQDLKTQRYVAYGVTDPSGFGLDAPATTVTISLANGSERTLRVSSQQATHGPDRGFYASVDDSREVMLLSPETVARFSVRIEDLEDVQ